jgi:hypothetical protein
MDSSYNREECNNVDMGSNNAPLMSPPALLSAQDYGLETVSHTPKMIKSLMHRKVIKISSGGVHNICIVEQSTSNILKDVYTCFMQNKYTDVVFKGFYDRKMSSSPSNEEKKSRKQALNQSSSDEDMQEFENQDA